jgi:hypothetical protein
MILFMLFTAFSPCRTNLRSTAESLDAARILLKVAGCGVLCGQVRSSCRASSGAEYPGQCCSRSRNPCSETGEPGGHAARSCAEAKWDGWRALVYIEGGIRVLIRVGRQVSDCVPELSGLVDALAGHRVILILGEPDPNTAKAAPTLACLSSRSACRFWFSLLK